MSLPFDDAYRAELDEMRFSDAEKERLVARLDAELAKGAEVLPLAPAGASGNDPAAEAGRGQGRCAGRAAARPRRRSWLARAAVVAGVTLALGAGATAAYATGTLGVALGYVNDIFTGAPAATEVVDEVGYPLGASASCNGVTVTAEAVLGDRYNYTVVFSVEKDDGTPFEGVEANEHGVLNLMFAGSGGLTVDGVWAAGGESYFYDADPTDNAVQYVVQMQAATDDATGIVGRTARVSLSDLSLFSDYEGYTTLVEGTWDLKFTMNFADSTVELASGQATSHDGADVTVDGLYVSSLGVTVDYTIDAQVVTDAASGKMSDEMAASQERVFGVPVVVTFADGSTFDATDAGGSCTKVGDSSQVHKGATFDRIVDVGDIASVTVGDVTVDVR